MLKDIQKASMWKRISAYIFDFIILSIVVVGIAFILSSVLGYAGYSDRLEDYYEKYEAEYGVSLNITEEEYNKYSEEQKAKFDEAMKALTSDNEVSYTYTMLINLTLIIISIGVLVGYMITEFVLPICFKNGQTLGKRIFGIGVMRYDSVKINNITLFVRTVLGKYTIETMVPILILIMIYFGQIGIVGTIIIGLLLILQIAMIASTKTNSAIHDLLANTVTVDIHSQMIFDSEEDLIAFKKRVHAEAAANAEYK